MFLLFPERIIKRSKPKPRNRTDMIDKAKLSSAEVSLKFFEIPRSTNEYVNIVPKKVPHEIISIYSVYDSTLTDLAIIRLKTNENNAGYIALEFLRNAFMVRLFSFIKYM